MPCEPLPESCERERAEPGGGVLSAAMSAAVRTCPDSTRLMREMLEEGIEPAVLQQLLVGAQVSSDEAVELTRQIAWHANKR